MIDNFYVAIDLIDHQPPLTVHRIWAGGTPHNPRTRGHGLWVGGYGSGGVRINFSDANIFP